MELTIVRDDISLAEFTAAIELAASRNNDVYPDVIIVPDSILDRWMRSRGGADEKAAQNRVYWAYLFSAVIKPGYPVTAIWNEPL